MPGTDLHSPAGVRPKFGHSLEHIVLRKKPPPPPGKETGAGGVAAPLRGPAPPVRAQADGLWRSEGESPGLGALRNGQLLAVGSVPEARLVPRGEEPKRKERWRRRAQARRGGARRAQAPSRGSAESGPRSWETGGGLVVRLREDLLDNLGTEQPRSRLLEPIPYNP